MSLNSIGYTVFGIPAYFFCAFTGFVISTCVFMILIFYKGCDISSNIRAWLLSLIGLMLFARLFGCFTGIYRAIGMHEKITISTVVNTGVVFYGGLFGMLLTYYLCLKCKLVSKPDYHILDILAVIFPLFHSIARVGCFLSGCCYGIESKQWFSILYTVNINGISSTAWRIPVQLIEAGFNICIFVYILNLYLQKDWKERHILARYLLIYSIGRFLLEFIRGDLARGIIAGVSFSQVISIIIFVSLFIIKKRSEY